MQRDIAPDGTIWWCTHCGRIAADKQGRMAALGWTRECTQNAVLVHESSMKLDESGRVVQADLVDKLVGSQLPRKIDQNGVSSSGSTKRESGAN